MKTKKIWPIILIVIIIAIAAGVIIFNSTDTARFRKQLNLGQRYLSEMNYEEAVVAFNQAIEIDPRSVDAYLGLADAYIGLGDEEAALAALKKGYEATGDERLKARIDEMEASQKENMESADSSGDLETVESVANKRLVVTGTIYETWDYCNPPMGITYSTYCFVPNEEQTVEMDGETYTLSLFGVNAYSSSFDGRINEILGQEITVEADIESYDERRPADGDGEEEAEFMIAPIYLDLQNILENGKTDSSQTEPQAQTQEYTLTGTVDQSENYFERDPQLYDEWCTYCLVLDEPRTFEVDGEEYTVSILALDGAEYTEEYGDNPFPEFWGMKVKVENASVYKSRYNFDVSPLACYIDEIYANE